MTSANHADAPDTVPIADPGSAFSGVEAAAVLAHELRGPLTVVNGYLDLLRRAEDVETRDYAIGAAQRAVERMDAIIDDVLESAKRSHDEARPKPIDPVDVVRSLLDETPAYRRRIEFSSGCHNLVRMPSMHLARAVSNVLDNALKFSPPSTTVQMMLVDDGGIVRIIVEDEGPGIPTNAVHRLRRRFERLERDATVPGYGIGLGVAVALVEAAGGEVSLGNRPDAAGARVELSVPAALEEPDAPYQ